MSSVFFFFGPLFFLQSRFNLWLFFLFIIFLYLYWSIYYIPWASEVLEKSKHNNINYVGDLPISSDVISKSFFLFGLNHAYINNELILFSKINKHTKKHNSGNKLFCMHVLGIHVHFHWHNNKIYVFLGSMEEKLTTQITVSKYLKEKEYNSNKKVKKCILWVMLF